MMCNIKDDKPAKDIQVMRLGRLAECDSENNPIQEYKPEFSLGDVFLTLSGRDALAKLKKHPGEYIERHATKDWGDVTKENAEANDLSIKNGHGMIFSRYLLKPINKFLCIRTELDHDRTMMLMGEEV